MRHSRLLVAMMVLLSASPLAAQEPANDQPTQLPTPSQQSGIQLPLDSILGLKSSEWMVTAGPAIGTVVFNSARDHHYMMQTLSWGRVLSKLKGSGPLRGQFQWAVEAVPVFGQFSPSKTYGVGISPIVWRWNFAPHGNVAQFVEWAGGGLWTHDPIPDRTTNLNFTTHLGYGVRYFISPHQAVVVGYRFHHISNGNRLERNPGVNAHMLQFGLTHVRKPHVAAER